MFKFLFLSLLIANVNAFPLQEGEVTDGHHQVIKPFEDKDFSAFNNNDDLIEKPATDDVTTHEDLQKLIVDEVDPKDSLAGPVHIKEEADKDVEPEQLPYEEKVSKLTEEEFINGETDHEKKEHKKTTTTQDETVENPETEETSEKKPISEKETHSEEEIPKEEDFKNEEFTSDEEEEGYGDTIPSYPVKFETDDDEYEEDIPLSIPNHDETFEEETPEEYSEEETPEEHIEEETPEEHIEETTPEEHIEETTEEHIEEETPEEHIEETTPEEHIEETTPEEHIEEETPEEHSEEEFTEENTEEEAPTASDGEEEWIEEETPDKSEEESDDVEWGNSEEQIPPPDHPHSKSSEETPRTPVESNHEEE